MRRPRLRWRFVTVSGPSMVPTLRSGDVIAARTRREAAPGQVVLARYRSMPERLVVKRLLRLDAGGAWLVSDNRFAGGDSDAHGPADIVGLVQWRVRPGRPSRVR